MKKTPAAKSAKPVAKKAKPVAKTPEKKSAYAAAGVDIDSKMSGIETIKKMVGATKTKGVLGGIGSFGGLFASPGKDSILVASTDGVGTKLKIAALMGKHDTVGQDIVNHCVNDILVQGALPLFFLDYIGASKFETPVFNAVISGLCKACTENGCALLGGETAEMPGLYPEGEYDLVGTIVGTVAKKDLITGADIKSGDVIIGLPSGGLQTNGYSLARRIVLDQCVFSLKDTLPGTRFTFGELLLATHKSFLKPIVALMKKVKIRGMAHITGGGFTDNIPRVLPKNLNAIIDRSSWKIPPLFTFLQHEGKVDTEEMYRVFNMGIGYVIIVRAADLTKTMKILEAAKERPVVIGKIAPGHKKVTYIDA